MSLLVCRFSHVLFIFLSFLLCPTFSSIYHSNVQLSPRPVKKFSCLVKVPFSWTDTRWSHNNTFTCLYFSCQTINFFAISNLKPQFCLIVALNYENISYWNTKLLSTLPTHLPYSMNPWNLNSINVLLSCLTDKHYTICKNMHTKLHLGEWRSRDFLPEGTSNSWLTTGITRIFL